MARKLAIELMRMSPTVLDGLWLGQSCGNDNCEEHE